MGLEIKKREKQEIERETHRAGETENGRQELPKDLEDEIHLNTSKFPNFVSATHLILLCSRRLPMISSGYTRKPCI